MDYERKRSQYVEIQERKRLHRESLWLQDPSLPKGPSAKKPCRGITGLTDSRGMSQSQTVRQIRSVKDKRSLVPSQQPNTSVHRPAENDWGKAVSQCSSAQVKVAAVVKATVRSDPEPAAKKRRKIHPSRFRRKGQLKLTITPSNGLFYVNIMEARGLMGREYRLCDSYVKISMAPEVDHSKRWKTRTVLECKAPVFNETFVFSGLSPPVAFCFAESDETLLRLWRRSHCA